MILIRKNNTNTRVFTLNENATEDTHDWVFVFTHDMTGEVKTFSLPDISLYPAYNEFEITEGGSLVLRLGDHSYKVYEMAISSPIDLDINNALAMAIRCCTPPDNS